MRYSSSETAGIKSAREQNTGMAQRKLAGVIFDNNFTYGVDGLRSKQSIYGQLRKVDAGIKAETAKTTTRRSRRAQFAA